MVNQAKHEIRCLFSLASPDTPRIPFHDGCKRDIGAGVFDAARGVGAGASENAGGIGVVVVTKARALAPFMMLGETLQVRGRQLAGVPRREAQVLARGLKYTSASPSAQTYSG